MLLGRNTEMSHIADLIHAARGGRSDVLVIRGEAGIGKSALLHHARQLAEPTDTVLFTRAAETESEIPYIHLADLIRPLTSELSNLAPRQEDALAGVLALGPAVTGDRYAVAAATLSLFGSLAQRGLLLILVDDAHWLDRFSAEVLTFVGNRFRAEGALVLVTVRTDETAPPGAHRFRRLDLTGLSDSAARELVTSTGSRLSGSVLRRLVVEAAGNPLALLELPALVTERDGDAQQNEIEPLPVTEFVERAFRRSVDRLPAECRAALLILAVIGSAPRDVLERALADAQLSTDALAPAEDDRLVLLQDAALAFRHPLIRATVHQTATPSQRRRAHGHVAAALVDSSAANALERRAWHLVAAGARADESVAERLERSAAHEYARANFVVAANLFERCSEVGERGVVAAGRLLRAADAYRVAGAIDVARQMLARAAHLADEPPLSLIVRYYMCRIDLWRGVVGTRSDDLVASARAMEGLDPGFASRILGDAALACAEGGQLRTAHELSARARFLAGDDVPLDVAMVRALSHALRGEDEAARRILLDRSDEIDAIDPIATGQADQLGLVAAMGHLAVEDVGRADGLLVRAISGARDASAVGVLPFRLGRLAWVRFWQGRWTAAVALANEALDLAAETGWTRETPNSLALLARVAACTGNVEDCRAHAERALTFADTSLVSIGHAHAALGLLALGLDDPATAAREFEAVDAFARPNELVDTPMLWWTSDKIEALIRLGRRDHAADCLDDLDRLTVAHGIPTLRAAVARHRAALDPARFEHHIDDALRWHAASSVPFEQARTEHALGVHLLSRAASTARPRLESALAAFERLGARPWVERARAHLSSTGGRPAAPVPLFDRLTPQELQVTLQVARGLSNRETAERLFLSVKTVEFHLGNVFHKLDIKRRGQLAAIIAGQDPSILTPLLPRS